MFKICRTIITIAYIEYHICAEAFNASFRANGLHICFPMAVWADHFKYSHFICSHFYTPPFKNCLTSAKRHFTVRLPILTGSANEPRKTSLQRLVRLRPDSNVNSFAEIRALLGNRAKSLNRSSDLCRSQSMFVSKLTPDKPLPITEILR